MRGDALDFYGWFQKLMACNELHSLLVTGLDGAQPLRSREMLAGGDAAASESAARVVGT